MKFNKILLVVASFLALAISSLGQNNIGTLVTDPIRPFSVSSTHPSAIANEIKGGPFTSSNLAGLSNIPAPRLEVGAIGYATNTGLYYRLTTTNPATWSPIDGGNITNLNASNITGSIPFLNISNALTNANVAFGTATFNNTVQGPIGVATNPAFRFGTNQSGFYYGSQLGFGQSVAVSIFGSNIARFQSNRVVFDQPIDFLSPTSGSALTTRTNLGIQDFVTNPVVQVVSGGTGATTAGGTRTNLGLGATNNVTFGELTVNAINNPDDGNPVLDLVNWSIYAGSNGVLSWDTNIVIFSTPINFNNSTNVAITRTNLGLAWSGLTNTSAATFRSALEMGTTNTLTIFGITAQNITVTAGGGITLQSTLTNAASFRTNIGLGWTALTNTTALGFQTALFGIETNPVLVNTNGDVVSPTNFWQRAPIQIAVQDFTGITVNQTNNATNARNVYVYSLATNVSGISNTIILPTNVSTFNGDEVTVVHKGTTNTTTVVRQAGSTNNLITLNKFDESVKFIRELGQWDFYHNISFVEPIQFSGTNASANAAASRTNLGLGNTNNVEFNELRLGGSDQMHIRGAAGNISFYNGIESENVLLIPADTDPVEINSQWNNGGVRSNLGLPLAALTNTSNTTFQQAIFTTNAAPTNTANVNSVGFNTAVSWMAVNIVTNGVTNTFHVPLFK